MKYGIPPCKEKNAWEYLGPREIKLVMNSEYYKMKSVVIYVGHWVWLRQWNQEG